MRTVGCAVCHHLPYMSQLGFGHGESGRRGHTARETGTDREISASFEQEKSATEVGQPTPVG